MGVSSNAKAETISVFKRAIDIGSSKVASRDAAILKAKEAKESFESMLQAAKSAEITEKGFKSLDGSVQKAFLKSKKGLKSEDWWTNGDARASFIQDLSDGLTLRKKILDNVSAGTNGVFISDTPIRDSLGVRAAGAKGFIKDFYSPSVNGKGVTALRAGATGLAYMGAATGIRYANGGSLTQNSSGERDIAGIPFI